MMHFPKEKISVAESQRIIKLRQKLDLSCPNLNLPCLKLSFFQKALIVQKRLQQCARHATYLKPPNWTSNAKSFWPRWNLNRKSKPMSRSRNHLINRNNRLLDYR